ncbi:MAG: CopG family transcriptional regulator [Steroidobacteraceae bacterium]
MGSKKRAAANRSAGTPRVVRASVSLRRELYQTLEALARQKKVSTAWILRDAAEKYVAEQWPLLETEGKGVAP